MDEIELLRRKRIDLDPSLEEEARALRLVMDLLESHHKEEKGPKSAPSPGTGVLQTLTPPRFSRRIPGPAVALLTALVVLAVGLAARILVEPPTTVPTAEISEETSPPTSPQTEGTAPAVDLTWDQGILPASALGQAHPTAIVYGGDRFVAFGVTETGRTVLWSSSDGRSWDVSVADESIFPSGAVVAEARQWEEGFVAFGARAEGPGPFATQDLFIWTNLRGNHWMRHDLDVQSDVAEQDLVFLRVIPRFLAAGPRSLLAGAWVRPEVDLEKALASRLPTGVDLESNAVTINYERGTIVVASELTDEVILTTTFEDLGIDLDFGEFEREHVLWRSTDGERWEMLDPSSLPPYTRFVDVQPWAEGFVALGFETRGERPNTGLWISPDGKTWTEIDIPEVEWQSFAPHGLVSRDDTLIVYGTTIDGRPAISKSTDARTWQIAELDLADGTAVKAAEATVGPLGFALLGQPGPGDQANQRGPFVVWFSNTGDQWAKSDLEADAIGAFVTNVAIGKDTLVAVGGLYGEVISNPPYWTARPRD